MKNDKLNKENVMESSNYSTLYKKMVQAIEELAPETEFYLRDIIPTPPTLLGRWLSESVSNNKILNVEFVYKDEYDTNKYRKVK